MGSAFSAMGSWLFGQLLKILIQALMAYLTLRATVAKDKAAITNKRLKYEKAIEEIKNSDLTMEERNEAYIKAFLDRDN